MGRAGRGAYAFAALLAVAGVLVLGILPAPRAAFALVATDGHAVTADSLRGRYLLLYFGYTQCRDVCPAALSTMAAAVAQLPAGRSVEPVFISVDPAHDTPAILARYLETVAPGTLGLTGTTADILRAERAFHVSAVRHANAIDHSSVLLLVGPDGRLVAPLRADASPSTTALAILAKIGRRPGPSAGADLEHRA